jgi:hypothetical protein
MPEHWYGAFKDMTVSWYTKVPHTLTPDPNLFIRLIHESLIKFYSVDT